jgi:hypothetical protein
LLLGEITTSRHPVSLISYRLIFSETSKSRK